MRAKCFCREFGDDLTFCNHLAVDVCDAAKDGIAIVIGDECNQRCCVAENICIRVTHSKHLSNYPYFEKYSEFKFISLELTHTELRCVCYFI